MRTKSSFSALVFALSTFAGCGWGPFDPIEPPDMRGVKADMGGVPSELRVVSATPTGTTTGPVVRPVVTFSDVPPLDGCKLMPITGTDNDNLNETNRIAPVTVGGDPDNDKALVIVPGAPLRPGVLYKIYCLKAIVGGFTVGPTDGDLKTHVAKNDSLTCLFRGQAEQLDCIAGFNPSWQISTAGDSDIGLAANISCRRPPIDGGTSIPVIQVMWDKLFFDGFTGQDGTKCLWFQAKLGKNPPRHQVTPHADAVGPDGTTSARTATASALVNPALAPFCRCRLPILGHTHSALPVALSLSAATNPLA